MKVFMTKTTMLMDDDDDDDLDDDDDDDDDEFFAFGVQKIINNIASSISSRISVDIVDII